MKWKLAGHISQMDDNRWTIRFTEWQIKGHSISWKTIMLLEKWHCWTTYWHSQGQQETQNVGGFWRRTASCSGWTQPRIENSSNGTDRNCLTRHCFSWTAVSYTELCVWLVKGEGSCVEVTDPPHLLYRRSCFYTIVWLTKKVCLWT